MALDRGECLLREIRLKAGLTQEELSYQLHKKFGLEVSVNMIAHYERDRKGMKIEVLRAMAIIFKRCMDDFYTWPIV
ncbi:MAG: helix-turn-helix domain-containing protein [Bacillota bacterium]